MAIMMVVTPKQIQQVLSEYTWCTVTGVWSLKGHSSAFNDGSCKATADQV